MFSTNSMACSSFLLFESLGHVPLRGLTLSNILVVDLRVGSGLVVVIGMLRVHLLLPSMSTVRLLLMRRMLFLVTPSQPSVVDNNVGALLAHGC